VPKAREHEEETEMSFILFGIGATLGFAVRAFWCGLDHAERLQSFERLRKHDCSDVLQSATSILSERVENAYNIIDVCWGERQKFFRESVELEKQRDAVLDDLTGAAYALELCRHSIATLQRRLAQAQKK
jgi:hypothetical protein